MRQLSQCLHLEYCAVKKGWLWLPSSLDPSFMDATVFCREWNPPCPWWKNKNHNFTNRFCSNDFTGVYQHLFIYSFKVIFWSSEQYLINIINSKFLRFLHCHTYLAWIWNIIVSGCSMDAWNSNPCHMIGQTPASSLPHWFFSTTLFVDIPSLVGVLVAILAPDMNRKLFSIIPGWSLGDGQILYSHWTSRYSLFIPHIMDSSLSICHTQINPKLINL